MNSVGSATESTLVLAIRSRNEVLVALMTEEWSRLRGAEWVEKHLKAILSDTQWQLEQTASKALDYRLRIAEAKKQKVHPRVLELWRGWVDQWTQYHDGWSKHYEFVTELLKKRGILKD